MTKRVLFAAWLALFQAVDGRAETFPEGSVIHVAHRGGIVPGYPENTLAAFRRAVALGVDAIEIDLRGTKDGHVVIVHDDVDLDTARLQARLGGGLAGHNGLRSIAQRLGSPDFLRLRIGVGRPGRGDQRPVGDYVLSPFAPEDDVAAILARASDAVETLAAEGLDETQRRFN